MISYEPLFRTMKEKGITSYRLFKMGFPQSNYYAMKHGENVSTNTINELCILLECEIPDVMEFLPEPRKYKPDPTGSGFSACQKSLAVESRPQAANKVRTFSAGACTWQKIPYRLQVCELSAISGQGVRAADCNPFVKKGQRPFLTVREARPDRVWLLFVNGDKKPGLMLLSAHQPRFLHYSGEMIRPPNSR